MPGMFFDIAFGSDVTGHLPNPCAGTLTEVESGGIVENGQNIMLAYFGATETEIVDISSLFSISDTNCGLVSCSVRTYYSDDANLADDLHFEKESCLAAYTGTDLYTDGPTSSLYVKKSGVTLSQKVCLLCSNGVDFAKSIVFKVEVIDYCQDKMVQAGSA